jgi:hypothetical protein
VPLAQKAQNYSSLRLPLTGPWDVAELLPSAVLQFADTGECLCTLPVNFLHVIMLLTLQQPTGAIGRFMSSIPIGATNQAVHVFISATRYQPVVPSMWLSFTQMKFL